MAALVELARVVYSRVSRAVEDKVPPWVSKDRVRAWAEVLISRVV